MLFKNGDYFGILEFRNFSMGSLSMGNKWGGGGILSRGSLSIGEWEEVAGEEEI